MHELFARYAYCIDTCDWAGLADIFTPDAEFTIEAGFRPTTTLCGAAEIIRFMSEEAGHPVAHHITNIFVDEHGQGARSHGRLMGVGTNGRVSTGHYRDEAVRTSAGWRVARRTFTMTRSRPE